MILNALTFEVDFPLMLCGCSFDFDVGFLLICKGSAFDWRQDESTDCCQKTSIFVRVGSFYCSSILDALVSTIEIFIVIYEPLRFLHSSTKEQAELGADTA